MVKQSKVKGGSHKRQSILALTIFVIGFIWLIGYFLYIFVGRAMLHQEGSAVIGSLGTHWGFILGAVILGTGGLVYGNMNKNKKGWSSLAGLIYFGLGSLVLSEVLFIFIVGILIASKPWY